MGAKSPMCSSRRALLPRSRLMRTNPVGRFFSPRLGGRQHGEKSEETQECPQAPRS
jgi:hypothetical protein